RPRAGDRRARATPRRRLVRRGDFGGPSRCARRAQGAARPLGAALRPGASLGKRILERGRQLQPQVPAAVGMLRGPDPVRNSQALQLACELKRPAPEDAAVVEPGREEETDMLTPQRGSFTPN